jgi:phytoene dehydrogenase-like protein
VKLRYNSSCERIVTEGGRVTGVQLDSGERMQAEHVVFNGDVAALAQGLLGQDLMSRFAPVPPAQRSLSAFTLSMHAQTQGFDLVRHNVFFNQDYRREFDDIFNKRHLPAHRAQSMSVHKTAATTVWPNRAWKGCCAWSMRLRMVMCANLILRRFKHANRTVWR